MNKSNKYIIFRRGFTIVELLIVIVVIGILAAISFVAYSGIQRSATESAAKDTLSKAVKAMKLERIQTGAFGVAFPDNIKVGSGFGIALTEVSDDQTFCINVTSQKYDDIMWHADENGNITEGLCSGDVISGSVIGDYNYSNQTPQSAAGTAQGDMYGFKVFTNEDWTGITLSWDSVTDATTYQLQTRLVSSGYCYWRYISNGNGNFSPGSGSNDVNSNFTGQIPSSTTSLNWATQLPYTSGQIIEYRLRPVVNGTPLAWSTAALSSPDNTSVNAPEISNFTVTPDTNWNNITMTWSEPTGMQSVPNPIYQLQTRASTTGTWYWRYTTTGNGNYTPGYGSYDITSSYTSQIPSTTTTLSWTNQIPYASGQTFEYRVRVSSSKFAGVFSDWKTVQLVSPDQSNTSAPTVSGFTVTSNPSWSTLDMSWSEPVGLYSIPNPVYQIQTRASTTGAWYWRSTSTGAGNYTPGYGSYDITTTYTGQIPTTTTTLNWATQIPYASGQTFEYKIRVNSSNFKEAYGPWTTVQLNR
ncbi:MAG TPA: prepilin-type N-terminal cleavage/methylation domain-containing protein [Candidatus Saccharibacteria bacterium]|nr:prepilin-type N-terminal cleavage/methylation domain-containing protein [Candidatus Saccharibacteria bacterium]HRQ98022.1 prepilin-type N-terminal cleavage/methylation domain-containing protein [Candidatus Saccharibacteria bacterium]